MEGAAPTAVKRVGAAGGGEEVEGGEESTSPSTRVDEANGGEEALSLGSLSFGDGPGGRVTPGDLLGDAVGKRGREDMDVATCLAKRAPERQAEGHGRRSERNGCTRDVGVCSVVGRGDAPRVSYLPDATCVHDPLRTRPACGRGLSLRGGHGYWPCKGSVRELL